MGEIDKKVKLELKGLLGTYIIIPKRKVRIIDDGGQFRIRIPKLFAEQLKFTEKDHFEFSLTKNKEDEWELKGELVKG